MQQEAEPAEPDVIISRWLICAAGLAAAWLVLGIFAVHHPDLQQRLTRSNLMAPMQAFEFKIRMGWLGIPVDPGILSTIAAVLVWVAFVRAEWSDRILFCAAAILLATQLLGGMEYAFHLASGQWYGSTLVSAGATTYVLCALLAHRARNRLLLVASIVGVAYSIAFPYYAMYDSILDIIGGLLYAAAVLCLSFFIAERAGVKPFAAQE